MTASNVYLLCFAFGFFWAIASLLLGSFHLHGHVDAGHVHPQAGHAAHFHAHAGHTSHSHSFGSKLWGEFLNMHSLAIFLAWFGGCGFLMTRHSGAGVAVVLLVSVFGGLISALAVASLLHFLHGKERELDPLDYDMVGVLGRVSSSIRSGGTGEILYSRDGARVSACARSEGGRPIERGVEVIVTRYEKGVAYVRTWDSMTDSGPVSAGVPEMNKRNDGGEASSAAK
jgi:membrane protein implicated in regulation of membrane protease activity